MYINERRRKYLKEYNSARYRKTRDFLIDILGGKCAKCSSTEELEFDHINQDEKRFSIGEKINGSLNIILDEIKKCQLLCHRCHLEKTIAQNDWTPEKRLIASEICRGDKNHNVKLTNKMRIDIKARINNGAGIRELAREYGVAHTTILKINTCTWEIIC
jgi:5-methylcytosine-specific restriction endonuclease McrA